MQDFVFVFITISIITGMIYVLYIIMLGSNKPKEDMELQISDKDILQQLNILYRQSKYSIVEKLASNYLKNKSKNDDVRFILAKSLFDLGDVNEAMKEVEIILKHQPTNVNVQLFLVNCYKKKKENQRAIDLLKTIIVNDSENIIAIKAISDLYNTENQKISAIKMYKRLNELLDNPNDIIQNKKTIAKIHFEMVDYEAAIEEYKSILELTPNDIFTKKCIIEINNITQNYEDLIQYASEIAHSGSADADTLWALEYLINTYILIKDYDNALQVATLMNQHPLSDKIKVQENVAKILFEQQHVEESIEILLALIKEQPQNIQLRKNLSRIYEQTSDFKGALEIYKDILRIAEPKHIEEIHMEISGLYCLWAEYLFEHEEVDECFKMFNLAIQYFAKNPEIYFKLGNINKIIKNFNEAMSMYKRAIEYDDKNAAYYEALAECYEEIGSLYEQKRFLIESLKYNPDNPNVNYKLGLLSYSQNDSNSAISYMKKAISIDENFMDAKVKLALIYEHVGNKEEAINIYENILKIEPENKVVLNNLKMLKSI